LLSGTNTTFLGSSLAPESITGMADYDYGYGKSNVMYDSMAMEAPLAMGGLGRGGGSYTNTATPQLDVEDRMMVTESKMSLHVEDVRKALDDIQSATEQRGGYVVNTNIRTPEGLSTGSIVIRVPEGELKGMLSWLRGSAIKVVSENITGHDITDSFIDTQERLRIMEETKKIYEDLMTKAVDFDDIERAQTRILSVQSQIDNLKGQLQYMEATSSSSLITINLATDEYELPYTPDAPWRPSVVFKYATRSMIKTVRGLASMGIWIGVYAVVWVPVLVVFIVVKKLWKKRKEKKASEGVVT